VLAETTGNLSQHFIPAGRPADGKSGKKLIFSKEPVTAQLVAWEKSSLDILMERPQGNSQPNGSPLCVNELPFLREGHLSGPHGAFGQRAASCFTLDFVKESLIVRKFGWESGSHRLRSTLKEIQILCVPKP
jgi:hypothetical protein